MKWFSLSRLSRCQSLSLGVVLPAHKSALVAYQQSEAVRLFVERATIVLSSVELNAENGMWVAEICRRLDGMPLAIELAAARVRALSVQQIAERLDDRFHLLTGGSRTASLRQQTLAATHRLELCPALEVGTKSSATAFRFCGRLELGSR